MQFKRITGCINIQLNETLEKNIAWNVAKVGQGSGGLDHLANCPNQYTKYINPPPPPHPHTNTVAEYGVGGCGGIGINRFFFGG